MASMHHPRWEVGGKTAESSAGRKQVGTIFVQETSE